MSAFKRFPSAQLDALKGGRAISLLVIEHRASACPDHRLSVIGTLDDEKFCGLFRPDADPDSERINVAIEGSMRTKQSPIESDSPDAHAIHRLGFDWDAGVRCRYLDASALMGRVLTRERLLSALDAVPATSMPDTLASLLAARDGSRRIPKPGQRRPRT
ncbi:MAG: hypothetical protein VX836_12470 [Pseudomonadota bacterium]|nr:hypothetical protein [Pseudomonadota bacterium]